MAGHDFAQPALSLLNIPSSSRSEHANSRLTSVPSTLPLLSSTEVPYGS